MAKHQEYGAGNIQRGGFQGILIRLGDKQAKLGGSFQRMNREKMEDHLIDTAGYALLGLLLLDGEIALPLSSAEEPLPLSDPG